MEGRSFVARKRAVLLAGILVLLGLYSTSLYSYLLFHSLVEMFSIVVACGIFMVAWNARGFIDNNYLLFIGIAYLFVGGMELAHTLAYKGMGVFHDTDADVPTQLWIATRYTQSLSLFIAPWFLRRRLKSSSVFIGYSAFVALLLLSIFRWNIFPDCFVEGVGLTSFKKISEYIISLIFLGSAVLLVRNRREFDPQVSQWLVLSILLTIVAELAFTFYASVYSLSNLVGHYFTLISFYLIYKAVIETGLVKPYNLLFRNLKRSEQMLHQANEALETKVEERTRELAIANEELQVEMARRKRVEEELRASESRFRQLYDEAPIGYYELDFEGRITRVNRTGLVMLGYAAQEMVGQPVWEFVVEQDVSRQAFHDKITGVLTPPPAFERTYRRKNGTIFPALVQNRLLMDAEDRITGIRSTILDVTERKQMVETLRESEKRLRLLSSQILTAQENERKRIARELHDGLGQILTAVKFKVEETLRKMGDSQGDADLRALESVLPMLQQGIEEARRIGMDLRPSILDDLGILATLGWFCREFQKIYSNISLEKQVDIQENDVPDPLKTVIYRVLQEAMHNVAKHSNADFVSISLKRAGERIEFLVRDNGQGFDPKEALSNESSRRGLGLSSMRERTELSSGHLTIESTKGGGTTIRASWPCES
jgi:PAS domain S-box-containing protein